MTSSSRFLVNQFRSQDVVGEVGSTSNTAALTHQNSISSRSEVVL